MSRLTELLRQARRADPQLGADLEDEIAALTKRRTFGLVFERHQPEAVELAGQPIRRGDKVRVLPPRGEAKKGDQRLWLVEKIDRLDGTRVAHIVEMDAEESETKVVPTEDLVVVAEFRDRIYPGLVETGRVERGGDKPFHTVINAENYHALEMLTYTHRHSIDAIYIDPPYNTGARDWKYNNDYVEGDDDYRHSKWLAFMERRLEVARELLNPEDSVLIVTIDEKEYLRLGMLLEQVFPEARIQMVSATISQKGVHRDIGMNRVDEYIFYAFLGSARLVPLDPQFTGHARAAAKTQVWYPMLRTGTDSSRNRSPGCFFPVLLDEATGRIVGCDDALDRGTDRRDYQPPEGTVAVFPMASNGTEGRWQMTPPVFRALHQEGFVKLGARAGSAGGPSIMYIRSGMAQRIRSGEIENAGRDADGSILVAAFEGQQHQGARSQWNNVAHDATLYGSNLIKRLLPDRRFPFPKSLFAVEDALRFFVATKPEATVLDFFSGSGTTAHAVMRLNKQDGGQRQSISVTNNEVGADEQKALRKKGLRPGDPEWERSGICDYITKPRVTAAITGNTPDGTPVKGDYKFTEEFPMSDGFEENAAFFTLTYESPLTVRHHRAFERVAPMLWLRAGSRGRIINDLGEDGWDVAEAYGVIENVDRLPDFLARVEEVNSVETVFVVTDSDAAFQSACRDLPQRVAAVRLYESYLHNFTINRRAGA